MIKPFKGKNPNHEKFFIPRSPAIYPHQKSA